MKKLAFYTPTLVAVFVMAPMIASAQTFANISELLNSFNVFLNSVVVPVVFAIALVVFLWGVVQTFILGGQDEDKQKKGKQLMLYAIIGFVVMLAIWGLVNFVISAFGLQQNNVAPPTPTSPTFPGVGE